MSNQMKVDKLIPFLWGSAAGAWLITTLVWFIA